MIRASSEYTCVSSMVHGVQEPFPYRLAVNPLVENSGIQKALLQ
jgi:hypothetical protein